MRPGYSFRSGGTWSQQGNKLVGSGPLLGISVAISGDGKYNHLREVYGGNTGAACVFTRSAGIWSQQGPELVGTGGDDDGQGTSVNLSYDGNTAIIGGPASNIAEGAAWIFTRSGGVWTQEGNKLVGTGAVGAAAQGSAVSLSQDGNTALVGGPLDNMAVGAAWVFTRSAGTWSQQGSKLNGSNAPQSAVGSSVSLSGDGNTAILGGPELNSGQGAALVFRRNGVNWAQEGTNLVGTGNVGPAKQGQSVAISADGKTVVVGGPNDNTSGDGAAWVFNYNEDLDWGDLPEPLYPTTKQISGSSHIIAKIDNGNGPVTAMFIGATPPDAEADGQPNTSWKR